MSSFIVYAQYINKNQLYESLASLDSIDSIHLQIPQISRSILLDEVTINSFNYYKGDSLRLRKEFASIFNSKTPRFKDFFITKNPDNKDPVPYYKATSSTASIVSLDVLSFIGLLGKNKTSRSKLQQTLLDKENADYLDRIFSQQKIQQLTGLKNDSLLFFMQKYRPNLSDAQKMTAYELLMYIKKSYAEYCKPD